VRHPTTRHKYGSAILLPLSLKFYLALFAPDSRTR
jgi:hypothetical protein